MWIEKFTYLLLCVLNNFIFYHSKHIHMICSVGSFASSWSHQKMYFSLPLYVSRCECLKKSDRNVSLAFVCLTLCVHDFFGVFNFYQNGGKCRKMPIIFLKTQIYEKRLKISNFELSIKSIYSLKTNAEFCRLRIGLKIKIDEIGEIDQI